MQVMKLLNWRVIQKEGKKEKPLETTSKEVDTREG